ncbi:hypothetical protein Tsubulata_015334 [Turnera subulata]|uniref:JmjC domain-containing protein n=1 Tax=Turnera subulata TaxID=218843 RepID=A0A9Q0FWR6_9ROSI|nr:hypothetical protein Tsubulata_015334 [Turnera subulata]
MPETEALPDDLRCKRTDGRQWRCNRRVMPGKKLCEIHHLQGRHRQYRKKVPESLKLQRKSSAKAAAVADNVGDSGGGEVRVKREKVKMKKNFAKFRKLGKGIIKKKVKRKEAGREEGKRQRGDLQLELIRMVLKREVEKRQSKKRKKRADPIESGSEVDREPNEEGDGVSGNGDEGVSDSDDNSEGELMRDLPNGFMAISPVKGFGNGGSCSSSPCDIKIGGAEFSSVGRRCFRSKNIEPMPIGSTLQVAQDKKDVVVRLRKGKRKKCHWCRRSGLTTMIRCSSCRKEFYCLDCIKDQYFDMEEEVKTACPVCRGTCSCKSCTAIQFGDSECKGFPEGNNKVNKVLHFHYLICMLLPVLKQINQDQSIELEIEAKIKGQKLSDVQIQQADGSCNKQCCCNNCKTSIVNFHRSCPNCSYNLCLICCHDIVHGSLPGNGKTHLCKWPNKRKACISSKQVSAMKSLCHLNHSYGSKYRDSSTSSPRWKASDGSGCIACPPTEFGGCGDSLLDLMSVFPLNWTEDLEINAEEIIGCYELPEPSDVSSPCSLCVGMDCEDNGMKQLQEAAGREDSNDNYLYYPSVLDIRGDNLDHFQKHWGKGQPVIIRNVLHGTSDVSWDPIVMFCTYLKNNAAKSENELASDHLDWFEVEIGVRQLFMGSFKGQTHANMWHEKLKLKGWLSSNLFQEHFPAHYAEIIHALPLPEYMDPSFGVLNIAAQLPQEFMKPDLGPCVYISYASGADLMQDDSVTKLRYDSYDVVNILAHTSDVPVSTEQLNYIRKLMKKHKEQNKEGGEGSSDGEHIEVGLPDIIREDMHLHKKVARVSWFSATTHEARALSPKDREMLQNGGHYSDSDSDTDTDTEVSKFFFGPVKNLRAPEKFRFSGKHTRYSGTRKYADSCGAQWDVFRRQDVPKLVEYLRRHSNEFAHTYGFHKHMIHPILDQKFFLDATHKIRLKEEFDIEPWTFQQHVGEAVIIPAGCVYQIRNLKSCVSVVLDFVSPENVTECIEMVDELRLLPENHKAKVDSLEVKKMALLSISRAIKEIRELTGPE